jgi:hypothetical protein
MRGAIGAAKGMTGEMEGGRGAAKKLDSEAIDAGWPAAGKRKKLPYRTILRRHAQNPFA